MTILVTGASGLLGSAVVSELEARSRSALALRGRTDLDLSDGRSVEARLESVAVSSIIHCAAMTSVDQAERNPSEPWQSNVLATRVLARVARARAIPMVYVSTGSVFDGVAGGYAPRDVPRPTNYYSWTKLIGEEAAISGGAAVLRMTVVGRLRGRTPKNFVEWLWSKLAHDEDLTLYTDALMNPLSARHAARACIDAIAAPAESVWHLGTVDTCSKAEFGQQVARRHFPEYRGAIHLTQMPSVPGEAPRPRNMWLDVEDAHRAWGMPTVQDVVESIHIEANDGTAAR